MRRILDALVTVFAVVGLLSLAVWLAVPSSVFMRPQALIYERDAEGQMWTIFVRETPFGEVSAQWESELEVLASRTECSAFGRSPYQPVADDAATGAIPDTVRWKTSPEMLPCVEAIRPTIMRHSWRVDQIGPVPLPVPLRPVTLTATLD